MSSGRFDISWLLCYDGRHLERECNVPDIWSIKESGKIEPGSALGVQTYFYFGFYFTYALALGRCRAPGEGTPE